VEAIANGVPLFKEPRVVRAKRTEMLLGVILGLMLLGLAVLARRWHIGPRSNQTVLSQIMGMAVGRHWAYYVVSLTITVVLALAANTSFGGLPILASLLARDNYLPHLFSLRGDRQVFANGIWVLAGLSAVLLIAVGREHQRADPALRHRGVHRVHPVPDRVGRPLVADPAAPVALPGLPSTGSAPW
jgi:amino acid transporter